MASAAALGIVALFGVYLVALAAASFLAPAVATRFLSGFATSVSKHYLELSARALVGAALVFTAPQLPLSKPFLWFGWLLLATTLALALLPWSLHRALAQRSVPRATRYLPLIGLASLAGGVCILASIFAASAA